MLNWLALRTAFGLPRWALIAAALLCAVLAILLMLDRIGTTAATSSKAQRDAGAASQRAQDLQTTLERTGDANAARAEIYDPGSRARYDQCLRSARTPANCQRFLPD
ncbi:hypothetical protein OVA07_14035 [Novosphingobium sp. SL115]|uniref:hypothetical protein n=1 Tax=Novosphingobium sp. SL115 TaxID=2995150 RepID=UPI002274BE86|nr:hypothetical protein [Novosphingobium sp. SL115]MCY1672123.1 hypothetical protein [Novosphingobium sp. SL115]